MCYAKIYITFFTNVKHIGLPFLPPSQIEFCPRRMIPPYITDMNDVMFSCLPWQIKTKPVFPIPVDLHRAHVLSDFLATVSNTGFFVTYDQLASSFRRCGQCNGYPLASQWGRVMCSPEPLRGRYVYASIDIPSHVLTLCEVRVFGGLWNFTLSLSSSNACQFSINRHTIRIFWNYVLIRWYPAKPALPAMLTHGR